MAYISLPGEVKRVQDETKSGTKKREKESSRERRDVTGRLSKVAAFFCFRQQQVEAEIVRVAGAVAVLSSQPKKPIHSSNRAPQRRACCSHCRGIVVEYETAAGSCRALGQLAPGSDSGSEARLLRAMVAPPAELDTR